MHNPCRYLIQVHWLKYSYLSGHYVLANCASILIQTFESVEQLGKLHKVDDPREHPQEQRGCVNIVVEVG